MANYISKIKFDYIAANIVSWILTPFVVIPLALISSHLEEIDADPWPFVLFICVAGFPLFFYYLYVEYKHKEKPWEFFVSIPRERRNPLLLMAIYTLLFNTIIFTSQNLIFWEKISILFVVYAGLMYLANKYFDKVSWHASAFAFSVFYIVDKIAIQYALLLILLPIIYWARIILHKHTWLQLYFGTVIGLVVGLLSWTIP